VRSNEAFLLDLKTKRNYINRIKESIYTFFSTDYAGYYNVGVRELSEEERTILFEAG
jgi:hypothetical protein